MLTANSTASAGISCDAEYVGVSGTLTFAPGETTKVVRVDLNDCGLPNPGTFTFNLSSPTNATIARATAQIQIVEGSGVEGTTQAVYVPAEVLLGAQYNGALPRLRACQLRAGGGAVLAHGQLYRSGDRGATGGNHLVQLQRLGDRKYDCRTFHRRRFRESRRSQRHRHEQRRHGDRRGHPSRIARPSPAGSCQRTVTSSTGSFTLEAAPGTSIVLTAFPPSGSQLVKASTGAITVPAAGLSGISITETGIGPLPGGLRDQWTLDEPGRELGRSVDRNPFGMSRRTRNRLGGGREHSDRPVGLQRHPPDGDSGRIGQLCRNHPSALPGPWACLSADELGGHARPRKPVASELRAGDGGDDRGDHWVRVFTGAAGVSFGGTAAESFTVEAG